MLTFEAFAQQFDINQPEEYAKMLHMYQAYIDRLWDVYGKRWTFCGGCHKTVRFDLATSQDEVVGGKIKNITRCPECGTPWFIREKE